MDSSVSTMMHGVRRFFRFAHIDGLIPADPAVYARLPKIHRDESRTQGLDRLELIRFLQVAQTITVHHGALAYLLGTPGNANANDAADQVSVLDAALAQLPEDARGRVLVRGDAGSGVKAFLAHVGRTPGVPDKQRAHGAPPERWVRPDRGTQSTRTSGNPDPNSRLPAPHYRNAHSRPIADRLPARAHPLAGRNGPERRSQAAHV